MRRGIPALRMTHVKNLLLAVISLLLIVAAIPGAGALPPEAGKLLFPLDEPAGLVASFGEYRPDHLHPGMDFSTRGRNGLPVRAVAAGRIFRLKVEWRGYGRALYIRHTDGRISVYAHLERYEDRRLGLEKRVLEERRRRGERYPGDIYLEPPVPVKGGDVIGFSGESGAGLPHLHFEMRREDQEPSDPLQPGWVAGIAAPVFVSVVFRARSPETWIEGERVREVPLSRGRDGIYVPARPLSVNGPFLPEARVDSRDPEGHRLGIKALSVRVDGVTTYDFRLESFRFSQYPEVGLLLDHARSGISPPEYTYFLARLKGNDLGGAAALESPWPSLAPGNHRLEVEAVGASGGVSRARVPFQVLPAVRLHWEGPTSRGARHTLRFGALRIDLGPGLHVAYGAVGGRGPVLCEDRQELPDGETCRLDAPVEVQAITADLFRGSLLLGRSTLFFPTDPGEGRVAPAVRIDPSPQYVDLRIRVGDRQAPPARLVLTGKAGGERRFHLVEAGPREFLGSVPSEVWSEASGIGVEWESASVHAFLELAALPHYATAASGLDMADCGVRFLLQPQSLYDDTPVHCEAPDPLPPPGEEMALLRGPVRLLPEGTPLARKGDLLFRLPADPHPERVGIYRLDRAQKTWVYQGGERAGEVVRLSVGRLDTHALLRDDSPPRILGVNPSGPDAAPSSRPVIRVRVEDRGAGLAYDGVHLVLDGSEMETEFDPDRGWSTAVPAGPLAPGRHDGTAWAVDRAGTRSSTLAFEIRVR